MYQEKGPQRKVIFVQLTYNILLLLLLKRSVYFRDGCGRRYHFRRAVFLMGL